MVSKIDACQAPVNERYNWTTTGRPTVLPKSWYSTSSNDVTSALMILKSPPTQLYVQQLVQNYTKGVSKVRHLWDESTTVDSPQKASNA